jgi:hypothetical protein
MRAVDTIILYLLIILVVFTEGCSGRIDVQEVRSDSTIVYPSKNPDDISVSILFYRKKSKKTGKLIGTGISFTNRKNRYVRALIDFDNDKIISTKSVFHLDWIGPNGKSIFRKQINILPEDSISALESAISISPDKRVTGKYSLKIYYFRELIAEKRFVLIPEKENKKKKTKKLTANVQLSNSSYKSGKIIIEDSIFKTGKKKRIHAIIKLGDYEKYKKDLPIKVCWKGPNSKVLFRKSLNFSPTDTNSVITSSITCYPQKRKPGIYEVEILLSGKEIASKKFEIR